MSVVGWAWSGVAPDGGRAPLNVTVSLDGGTLGQCLANVYRPNLVNATGAPDPYHGFLFQLSEQESRLAAQGNHTFSVEVGSGGTEVQVFRSPMCFTHAVATPCPSVAGGAAVGQ